MHQRLVLLENAIKHSPNRSFRNNWCLYIFIEMFNASSSLKTIQTYLLCWKYYHFRRNVINIWGTDKVALFGRKFDWNCSRNSWNLTVRYIPSDNFLGPDWPNVSTLIIFTKRYCKKKKICLKTKIVDLKWRSTFFLFDQNSLYERALFIKESGKTIQQKSIS